MTSSARSDFRKQALATRRALRSDAIEYKGLRYEGQRGGSVSTTNAQLELKDGGFQNINVLTWRIAKTILSEAPVNRAELRYQNETWIINEIGGDEVWKDEWIIRAVQ